MKTTLISIALLLLAGCSAAATSTAPPDFSGLAPDLAVEAEIANAGPFAGIGRDLTVEPPEAVAVAGEVAQ